MGAYLIRFAQIWPDFRLCELASLCTLFGVPFPALDVHRHSVEHPFLVVHFEGDAPVQQLLSRSILIMSIQEVYTHGASLDALVEATRALGGQPFAPYGEAPFRFAVDHFDQTMTSEEQVGLINRFAFLPLSGPVSLKAPAVEFVISCVEGASPGSGFYFCRTIGRGRRDLIDRFNLKKRHYLGTTSMDAELSLIMCNMALVLPGRLVYDPFVGTGSFLCTAAAFGALTLGSDIDGRQMRGRGTGASAASNWRQYGVEGRIIDGCIFDILHHPWREAFMVDAIVTDPPYGVRAGAKKIGMTSALPVPHCASLTAEEKSDRYPKTVPYEMGDLVADLHRLAVKVLRDGGRLVYWHPVEVTPGCSRPTEAEVRAMVPVCGELRMVALLAQRCRQFDRYMVVCERLARRPCPLQS